MYTEKDIAYENGTHWVLAKGNAGYEVYRTTSTHSERRAIIGFTGVAGLRRAIVEADRRDALEGAGGQYGTRVKRAGHCVASSRNLRGMRDYARVSRIVRVETMRHPNTPACGLLRVEYADGACSLAHFASFNIMHDWVRARRSWRGAKFSHLDGDMGYLTRPGVIAGEVTQ